MTSTETNPTTDDATPPVTPQPPVPPIESDDQEAAGKRAARQRAQQAEQERDQLAGQLATVRRATVEARIPSVLPQQMYGRLEMYNVSDLWDLGGHQVDEFFADDGSLDDEALLTALDNLHTARPHLFGNPSALHGVLSSHRAAPSELATTMQSEMRKARNGTA